MKKIVAVVWIASIFIFIGCNKDSSTSKEVVSYEKISKEDLPKNDDIAQNSLSQKIAGESVVNYFDNHCSSCHGNYGERSALSRSRVIADLSEDEINFALKGFKDGTYGGEFAATMKANIKNLKYEELNSLAKYIANEL
ncbi:c-type cytochrome [Campylobacter corcagiensis]|uniref:Cytochrome c domain-containing protein n=1 Tax=Campylobacter corcagiensis TaxID=1448857 RepID=A0A7M1LHT5_9BACT|nr:c-type cytochrome [Campylobacter corcagiensis]QKF65425.1 putative cytochrome c [Campylobacter corcagiensis]QOQ88000.1 hypothetical protein IMC76_04180 [Campylobacter corcagiensis]